MQWEPTFLLFNGTYENDEPIINVILNGEIVKYPLNYEDLHNNNRAKTETKPILIMRPETETESIIIIQNQKRNRDQPKILSS
jgi:hypothetical protein